MSEGNRLEAARRLHGSLRSWTLGLHGLERSAAAFCHRGRAQKMTEGEVDESSLHGVQEVCRDFAVLEDGALAHCLQEQEIEQHYASNIQKNKLVQKDIRIAKKLQDEEDHQSKLQSLQKQKQIEERDLAYAHAIQEELRRKAEECQQREEDDQEVARKLQELEEVELQGRRRSLDGHSRRRGGSARHCRDGDRLEWHLSELQLQNCDQVLRDEELARRLQEEEEKEMATLTPQGHNEDFRAAQVAQDEEIAKYMQHQELRAHQRSRETEPRRKNSGEQSSVFERWRHADAKAEVAVSHPERLNSDGLASPTEEHLPERSDPATEGAKHLLSRNIAEALDPTFKSSPQEPSASTAGVRSQECSVSARPCALPVDGFYDFMDEGSETVFVPPTKRQLDKSGQQKSRDKKEGCKQQ
ncbi:coiled-coil domain-containing protein 50-like isoform X4 [Rhinatrema bivittatum]|uniref:coiled-coil domain-containing protein 50-like isoform X4 n=1 Tax=Rhinatrema bivittatum TaxID=194408 RepID=UPI0011264E9C|nr:coiled-coil domain-containing protein 50-like isoform X4 [Rhinatrema bivittatum]